jgi:hypothetical protein
MVIRITGAFNTIKCEILCILSAERNRYVER